MEEVRLRRRRKAARLEAATDWIRTREARFALRRIQLHKATVLDRVANRFTSRSAVEEWFSQGRIPGFGDATPREIVARGEINRILRAIDAIEAGVHA